MNERAAHAILMADGVLRSNEGHDVTYTKGINGAYVSTLMDGFNLPDGEFFQSIFKEYKWQQLGESLIEMSDTIH